jgi:hypothetical protein
MQMNRKSAPYPKKFTEAHLDKILGPPSAERDRQIQGWTGKQGIAFVEGWVIGHAAARRKFKKRK